LLKTAGQVRAETIQRFIGQTQSYGSLGHTLPPGDNSLLHGIGPQLQEHAGQINPGWTDLFASST
jgi:hypothetical protein